MTPEELEALAAQPSAAAVDGRSATARSADDVLKLLDRAAATDALAGTNTNGGPRSLWNGLRPAVAVNKGGAGW